MALVVLRLLATLACPIRLRLVALGRQWCCRVAFTLLLFAFNRSHPDVDIYGPWVQETAVAVTFPALGFLIHSRRPQHPIGWLFCGAGLVEGWESVRRRSVRGWVSR